MSGDRSNPLAATQSLAADIAAAVKGKESSPAELRAAAEDLEQRYAGGKVPEAIRMLVAIACGSLMGPGDGWFRPGESRYDWVWLANQHGVGQDGRISALQFRGKPDWFARLDRNQDGAITAEDLDWSEDNSWVHHAYVVNRLLRRLDTKGNGRLTRAEWIGFFDSIADDQDSVNIDQLRDAWVSGVASSFFPGDAPTLPQLLHGLLTGEVGSLHEGPGLNDLAPDFTLKTFDGSRSIHLQEMIGSTPVVLVFGNFTCSPFRSMYPGVEQVFQRFQGLAMFLGIYVREAHPTDGWKMQSNARVGVSVQQPKSFAERSSVAGQCHRLLNARIPLLVDDIDDRVGHAYSGMPARLYVIDRTGKVAYKSGRGPFGFKVGEMEQSLLMTLLDEQTAERKE